METMEWMGTCICGEIQKVQAGQSLQHAPRLAIDVWNCQARLMICDGVKMRPAPKQPPHEMLEEAIWQAGGAINISGIYPPSLEILQWAEKHLPPPGEIR